MCSFPGATSVIRRASLNSEDVDRRWKKAILTNTWSPQLSIELGSILNDCVSYTAQVLPLLKFAFKLKKASKMVDLGTGEALDLGSKILFK